MRASKLAAAAGAAVVLSLGAALPASASSGGCAFSNGCATLHGFDAGGTAIAMDAKGNSAKAGTIEIGYPDKPGDGATSFDAVLHYTSGKRVTTYQDTGLQVRDFDNTCNIASSHNHVPQVTPPGGGTATGAITASGNDLAVSTGVSDLSITGGGTATLNWTAVGVSGPQTLTIAETYGSGCVSLWQADVTAGGGHATFLGFTPLVSSSGGHISETDTGSSVDTFSDSVPGGTFTFSALPAGVSQSGGVLTANTSTAVPGTYTSVGVIYTQPGGVINTASFTLVISGIKSVSPGAPTPFYTFAFAKGGVWSNECVTNANGSGALQLQACTLGKNHYQDFYALNSAGVPQGDLLSNGGGTYHIQNFLAAYGSPVSCLVDAATVNPATPETDAFDTAVGGRQLHVNGSCTSNATGFSWGT